MQLVETVLGNVKDAAWKAKLADASVDVLELSQWDAQKNRLRKETKNGLNVAVSLDRDTFLHDGDVLLWDEDTRQAVICKIDLCEVLVIDLGSLSDLPLPVLMERSVALDMPWAISTGLPWYARARSMSPLPWIRTS